MNTDNTSVLREKLIAFYNQTFTEFLQNSEIKSQDELVSAWREFHSLHIEAAGSAFIGHVDKPGYADSFQSIEKIESPAVAVEVIDRETGMLFRRELPLNYLETDNGIILSGENSNGAPSTIAFLSDTALHRINDLRGKGPDEHACDH